MRRKRDEKEADEKRADWEGDGVRSGWSEKEAE